MDSNLIFGIRPVAEAIEAGKQIEKLYIRKGAEGQLMQELKDLCMRHRLHYQEVPVEKLNRLTRGNHQGVVAQTAAIVDGVTKLGQLNYSHGLICRDFNVLSEE